MMATFTSFPLPNDTPENINRQLQQEFLSRFVGDLGLGVTPGESIALNNIIDFSAPSSIGSPTGRSQRQIGPSTSNRRQGISRQPSAGGIGATPQNLRAIQQSNRRAQGQQQEQLIQNPLPEIIALASQIASAGGTEEARAASADLARTRDALLETVSAFTPARAQQLASGVVDDIFRRLREEIAPQINAIAEAGGASRGALRALLLQDAEARAGEAAARAVLETIIQFGQIQTQAGGAVADAAEVSPISTELTRLIAAAPSITRFAEDDVFSSTRSRSRTRSRGNALRGLPIPQDAIRRTRIV